MSKKPFYSCPKCNARHSTEAWTYKTRKEFGIDNIDEYDIVHMNEIKELLEASNEFYCPSCNENTIAKEIYEFEQDVIHKMKVNLTNVLIYLQMNEEKEAVLKKEISQEEDVIKIMFDNGEWHVQTPDMQGFWDSFEDMEDTIDYLLKYRVQEYFVNYVKPE